MPVSLLVLHVGMPRTATTSVQRSLAELRPQLHRRGVGYLGQTDLTGLPASAGWRNRVGSEASLEATFNAQFEEVVTTELAAAEEQAGSAPKTLFISSEALVGARVPGAQDAPIFRPFAEDAITQIVDVIDPVEVQLLLTVRRQDRLMESSHVWEVQKGRTRKFRTQFPFWAEPQLSYPTLLDRLTALPRVSTIAVRPYELIGAGFLPYLRHLLSLLPFDSDLDVSHLDQRHMTQNRSYSQNALVAGKLLNHHLETDEQRAAAKKFFLEQFPSPPYPPATLLEPPRREKVLEAYREDNRALFERWMPDLPSDSYDSDENTERLSTVLRDRPAGKAAPAAKVAGVLRLFRSGAES